jgi:hypothetical protein
MATLTIIIRDALTVNALNRAKYEANNFFVFFFCYGGFQLFLNFFFLSKGPCMPLIVGVFLISGF